MTRSLLASALTLALAGALASGAAAQASVDAELVQIREQIFQARFSDAVSAANGLLARPDLDARQRNAALEVLATAQIANRDRAAARATLEQLYARDPGHRLTDPDASPPVIAAFARAREQQPDPVDVTIVHEPPRLSRRESPEITARVSDGGDAVAELRLVYRSGANDAGRVVMTPRGDGSYAGRIPVVGAASAPSEVSYHLVALAPSLTPLGQLGSDAEPLRVTVPAGQSEVAAPDPRDERPPVLQGHQTPVEDPSEGGGSVAEEWWFWTLIAVLVVGGGVATGVVLATQGSGPEPGTLGVGQLMLLSF